MPGFISTTHGLVNFSDIARTIGKKLTEGQHFKIIKTNGANTGTIGNDTTTFTLEATSAVDPMADTQKWRIRIDSTADDLNINVATPLQLPDDGTVVTNPTWYQTRTAGHITGVASGALDLDPKAFPQFDPSSATLPVYKIANEKTIERKRWNPSGTTGADPMSVMVMATNHGIFISVWVEDADDQGSAWMWMNIQRPVNPKTGEIKVDKKAPLFCVYSLNGGGPVTPAMDNTNATFTGTNPPVKMTEGTINPMGILKFTVRETDVSRPSDPSSAVFPHRDNRPIMVSTQQISMSEDNKYILTFPNGLHTKRHAYPDELDQIAYTSADVISEDSLVDATVYGEAAPRKYRALKANGMYNTGMRLFVLEQSVAAGLPPAS